MPIELWVKSFQALSGCRVQETLALTKADGSVRAHSRRREKEMEQKENPAPNQTLVLTSRAALEVCRSQWRIARARGKAGGVKMIEGCVPHYPGLPWQGCKIPVWRKILSFHLSCLSMVCSPPVIPGHSSLVTPSNSFCNLAAKVAFLLPHIPAGCSMERGKARQMEQIPSVLCE